MKQRICVAILVAAVMLMLLPPVVGQTSQQPGHSVPFTIDRNKIIIPTVVNGSQPLRLILDTGMKFDGVYLFHEAVLDWIDTTGAIEVHVGGAGSD